MSEEPEERVLCQIKELGSGMDVRAKVWKAGASELSDEGTEDYSGQRSQHVGKHGK